MAEEFLAAVRDLEERDGYGNYSGVCAYTRSGRKYMVYIVGLRGSRDHLGLARWDGPEDRNPTTSFYRGARVGSQGGLDFTRRYDTTPIVRWCLAERQEDGTYARYKA